MTATEGIVVLLGRVFAVFFLRSGIAHVRKHEGMTGYAVPPDPVPWDRRLAGRCLAPGGRRVDRARHLGRRRVAHDRLFLVLAALYFHRYRTIDDDGQRQTQAGNFYRNVALLGASLALLGFFVAAGEAVRFTITGPLF